MHQPGCPQRCLALKTQNGCARVWRRGRERGPYRARMLDAQRAGRRYKPVLLVGTGEHKPRLQEAGYDRCLEGFRTLEQDNESGRLGCWVHSPRPARWLFRNTRRLREAHACKIT